MRRKKSRLYLWLKKHISAVAFATGFIWDTFTLTRIDLLYENIVFISYLVVAFAGIVIIHSVETRVWTPKIFLRYRAWLPAVVQFPLGGLFSGFVIFYTKSASVFTSWPFLVILLSLFVGNEFFRKRYERLIFQISLFYFALLSYLVLVTPAVLHTLGTGTFILAGLTSLFIMALLLQSIMRLFPRLYKQSAKTLWYLIGAIYVSFNVLYFTNTIPPVPLALKEIGVYHSVVRIDVGYHVSYEKPAWYEGWRDTSRVYRRTQNEAAYCFSSVFAPTRLRTQIHHSWQRKTKDGEWIRESLIPFTISGGRDGGYRGYTIKQNLTEGTWRCVVETANRQVIGMTTFNIINVNEPTERVEGLR